jgi:hypothetical protein
MQEAETAKILAIRQAAFSIHSDSSADQKRLELVTWHEQLKDIDFKTAYAALSECIAQSSRVPMIHDIREKVTEYQHPELTENAETAWIEYRKCFSASDKRQAWEALPELTKSFTDWRECIENGALSADQVSIWKRKEFIENYQHAVEVRKKYMSDPERLRDALSEIRHSALESTARLLLETAGEDAE